MSAIEEAKIRRAALVRELAIIDRFIADYCAFERGEELSRSRKHTFIRGQKDEVLGEIIKVLERSQGFVRNSDIARRIEESGFKISAKNPASYVAIIIHRNQDKIERTKSGSRLRDWTKRAA